MFGLLKETTMAEAKKTTKSERRFEVLVSFDGLDKGERFSAADDAWSQAHVTTGYLRDVTDEPTVAEAQGEQAPQASAEKVQEAHDAGAVGQG